MRPRLAPSAALLLLAAGCAAPSFVGNTGRVTPRHGFRVVLGSGYQVHTSAAAVVRDGRDAARTLDEKRRTCPELASTDCWDLADVEPVVDAAYRFAVVAPLSTSTEAVVRWGFAGGFDVGARFGPGVKGLDLGWQAFGPRDGSDGWAGTLLAGVSSRSMGTLGDTIEGVLHGEASLRDYGLTFVTGRSWAQSAHVYLGARAVLTDWTVQVVPDIPIVYDGGEAQAELLGTDPSGLVWHSGAVFGAAIGYKRVWLGAELNVLWSAGGARVLFQERSFSGLGAMPAVYLYAQ